MDRTDASTPSAHLCHCHVTHVQPHRPPPLPSLPPILPCHVRNRSALTFTSLLESNWPAFASNHAIMRVLVTGASGYCGQFVADALLAQGHHVICCYRSAAAACEGLSQGAAAVELNLTDAASCESCLVFARPDVIFNFAAVSSPVACEKDPETSHAINCPTAFFEAVSRLCS